MTKAVDSWSEVKLAFESTCLSADAVARSVEDIVTMAMTETDRHVLQAPWQV